MKTFASAALWGVISAIPLLSQPALATDFKVAAVLPGVVTDKSFNQQVFEGLNAAKKSGGG